MLVFLLDFALNISGLTSKDPLFITRALYSFIVNSQCWDGKLKHVVILSTKIAIVEIS